MKTIVAFDCDGTLIRGDATRCFLLLLLGPLRLLVLLLQLLPELLDWSIGLCSTAQFKQILIDRAIQVSPHSHLRNVLEEKLPQAIRKQLKSTAKRRLLWHQDQGHRCIIITASPKPFVQSLADDLCMELIATGSSDPLQLKNNEHFLLTTPNCKGVEKVRRLEQYLGILPVPDLLEAYGDSRGDKELLNASARPHFRSFSQKPNSYYAFSVKRWVTLVLAIALLVFGLKNLLAISHADFLSLQQSGLIVLKLLPAFYGLLALSYFGRYCRWRILLGSVEVGKWSWNDAQSWFSGFALTATPGKLGELSRVQDLYIQFGYPRLLTFHAFFAERLCDAGAVIIWFVIVFPIALSGVTNLITGELFLTVFFFSGLLLYLMMRLKMESLWKKFFQYFPRGVMAYACGPALLISLITWGIEGLILWLLVINLSPIAITPALAIGIYLFSGTAGFLSSVPAGIGINEAATVLLIQQQGVPISIAISIAIFRRVLTVWSITGLAIFVMFKTKISRLKMSKS